MSPWSKEKTLKNSIACCLYILHLITMAAPAEDVTGFVNDVLNLPCNYTVYPNTYTMCWGRGPCSLLGCNDEIIRTNGTNVIKKKSTRYNLLGSIQQRDVSLTITGLTKEDEGTYCCRVEVNGLNNDQKNEFKVKIENANDFFSPVNPTTWKTSFGTQETTTPDHSTPSVIGAILGAVTFVAVIGVIVWICQYRRRMKKTESAMSAVNREAVAETRNASAMSAVNREAVAGTRNASAMSAVNREAVGGTRNASAMSAVNTEAVGGTRNASAMSAVNTEAVQGTGTEATETIYTLLYAEAI